MVRLMSPTRRRLISVDYGTDAGRLTVKQLVNAGWKPYTGTGTADARGWYQGDDPALEAPEPVKPPAARRAKG